MVSKPNQSLFVAFGQLLNASTPRCAQVEGVMWVSVCCLWSELLTNYTVMFIALRIGLNKKYKPMVEIFKLIVMINFLFMRHYINNYLQSKWCTVLKI